MGQRAEWKCSSWPVSFYAFQTLERPEKRGSQRRSRARNQTSLCLRERGRGSQRPSPPKPCCCPFLQGSWGAKRFQIFPDHPEGLWQNGTCLLRLSAYWSFLYKATEKSSLTEKNSNSQVKPLWDEANRWRNGIEPAQIRFMRHFPQRLLFYKPWTAHTHHTTSDAGTVPRWPL